MSGFNNTIDISSDTDFTESDVEFTGSDVKSTESDIEFTGRFYNKPPSAKRTTDKQSHGSRYGHRKCFRHTKGDMGADIPDPQKFEGSNVPGLKQFPIMQRIGHPLPGDIVAKLKQRVNQLYLSDPHAVDSLNKYQQLYRKLWCIQYIKHQRKMRFRK